MIINWVSTLIYLTRPIFTSKLVGLFFLFILHQFWYQACLQRIGELINKKVQLNQKPNMKIILLSHLILHIEHLKIFLLFHLIHHTRHHKFFFLFHIFFLSKHLEILLPFQLILHIRFFDSLFRFFRIGFLVEELITFRSFDWFESLIK